MRCFVSTSIMESQFYWLSSLFSIACFCLVYYYHLLLKSSCYKSKRRLKGWSFYYDSISNKKVLCSNKRYYSISSLDSTNLKDTLLNRKNTSRKTLSSPEAKPYADLYKGRGKPKNDPTWVKNNGMERSPFGASWAKNVKYRLPFPAKYPCNYHNITDPFNKREMIKKICKGNRVIYIWTYQPTGVCLVGSSSNSVERVLSYFDKKYLFLDNRRGVQFLADYGFKDIQLTIIYYNYRKYTMRDIKLIEAYYINELNSSLNTQKSVYLPPEGGVQRNRVAFIISDICFNLYSYRGLFSRVRAMARKEY